MSTLCKRRVIDFDDVSLGEFVDWLFNYAEDQEDGDYAEILKFFDRIMGIYFDELNPHYADRASIVTYEHGQDYYEYYSDADARA